MTYKYNETICNLSHVGEVPKELLESLPENQGHPVRHRCAACAYIAGLNEAAKDIADLVERIRELTEENIRLKSALT